LDDEMINQYIRRSEEEYEEFTRMDEERYAREKAYYSMPADAKKNYNYRLMKETEIPSWFIETVPSLLFSLKTQRLTRSTAVATATASRSTTATRPSTSRSSTWTTTTTTIPAATTTPLSKSPEDGRIKREGPKRTSISTS
jgi:hypothetical protein